MKKFVLFIASGFGLGLVAPVAPGTVGSLPGVLLVYLTVLLPVYLQVAVALLLAVLAIPVCGAAERTLGIKDDGRIAADEWMLLPLSFIALPLYDLPWWSIILFFAVVRIVDIAKPFPCRRLQSIKGGLGVVIDDFIANLYSLGINHAVAALIFYCIK